jgi:hypothetical protein
MKAFPLTVARISVAGRRPGEPPHDGHEHAHEGPRVFRRYPSDTLTLTDSLTAVLVATTAVLLHEGVEGGEKIGHD